MKVHELTRILSQLNPDLELTLRDLNGLDWFMEPKNIREEDGHVVIDTQGINRV